MNSKIWTIRNKRIILDSDLAELCQIETKVFNQTIKRNINLFSENNRFQLNNDEFDNLRSQIVTSSLAYGGRRYLPFAFTKEGVEIAVKILKKDVDINFLFEEITEADLIIQNSNLHSKIHNIRGLQVMLDFDLAQLYQVKTRELNQAVKRNIERFPEDFMFELNENEMEQMVSQFVTPSKSYFGGSKPYAFTEQGVTMLSSVLNSSFAIQVNLKIIRTFVQMRKFIVNNATVFQRLNNLEHKQISTDVKLDNILNAIEANEIKPKQAIFYKGQMFDAYKLVSDIIREANKSIILIDNYIDDTVLQLFTKRNKNIETTFYTQEISNTLKQDLKKHNSQYEKIEIKKIKFFHDRFIVIDEKTIYHFGVSLKDLGKKCFAFSKLDIDAKYILKGIK